MLSERLNLLCGLFEPGIGMALLSALSLSSFELLRFKTVFFLKLMRQILKWGIALVLQITKATEGEVSGPTLS